MAKATKKQALGRGLSALLKDPENDIKSADDKNADKVVGNIIELDLGSIHVNPFQPRTSFNDETLLYLREKAWVVQEHWKNYSAIEIPRTLKSCPGC